MHAEGNLALTFIRPSDSPINALCLPFKNSTGSWTKNDQNPANCTDLAEGELAVQKAYEDKVCPKDLPPDADQNNPDFVVRLLLCISMSGQSSTLPKIHCPMPNFCKP
jgi:hypothetical protein